MKKMDTNYVFTEEAQKRLTILHNYLEAGFPVFLEGPTGTSKTFSFKKLIKYLLHFLQIQFKNYQMMLFLIFLLFPFHHTNLKNKILPLIVIFL